MINLKRKDSVADAVQSVLNKEEIDDNYRTKDMLGGRVKSDKKDDVGPSSDFKSTKVKFRAGPSADTDDYKPYPEKGEPEVKQLSATSSVKTVNPIPRDSDDVQAKAARKKLGMKESVTLKGFKERYEDNSIFEQLVNEVLSKDASAGQWIHDFVHSDNPKFAGKSKAERKKQALAAYYAKQRNEEVEQVEEGLGDTLKKVAKKTAEVLGGPDDEGHKKDLQKKMGIPQTGKPAHAKQNEEVEQVEEGWDDMLKDVKSKKGPQPSGGSGIKQGSRYGGGKQKDKPEHDEDKKKVSEAKEEDAPFSGPYSKKPAEQKDKSGAQHTPMSRAKHLARLAMGKIRKDMGEKK